MRPPDYEPDLGEKADDDWSSGFSAGVIVALVLVVLVYGLAQLLG